MNFQRFSAIEPKVCSTCGRKISDAEWSALKLVGYQVIPPFESDPGEVLELKNDICGSTLAVLMPFTARELEDVLDQMLPSNTPLRELRALAIERLKKG